MWHESARTEKRILMGKPVGMKILGRHRGRWEVSYTEYIKEMRLEGVNGFIWFQLGINGWKL
jgi:hypothetical protein